MPAMHKLSSYKTTVAQRDGRTVVTYHSTPIVEWDADRIILRTGGWDTVTTRRKMQQAAHQFGLNFYVYREKGTTYVKNKVGRIELGDGVTIDRCHYANRND